MQMKSPAEVRPGYPKAKTIPRPWTVIRFAAAPAALPTDDQVGAPGEEVVATLVEGVRGVAVVVADFRT